MLCPVPDETAICKFRHLLEKHNLTKRMFAAVSRHLEDRQASVPRWPYACPSLLIQSRSWLNQQMQYDLWQAEQHRKDLKVRILSAA